MNKVSGMKNIISFSALLLLLLIAPTTLWGATPPRELHAKLELIDDIEYIVARDTLCLTGKDSYDDISGGWEIYYNGERVYSFGAQDDFVAESTDPVAIGDDFFPVALFIVKQYKEYDEVDPVVGCRKINVSGIVVPNLTETFTNGIFDKTVYYRGKTKATKYIYNKSGDFETAPGKCYVINEQPVKVYQVPEKTIIDSACNDYTWNTKSYPGGFEETYSYRDVKVGDSIVRTKTIKNGAKRADVTDSNASGTPALGGLPAGCDSILTLKLWIFKNDTIPTTAIACDQYTWKRGTKLADTLCKTSLDIVSVSKNEKRNSFDTDGNGTKESLKSCNKYYSLKLTLYKASDPVTIDTTVCDEFEWKINDYYLTPRPDDDFTNDVYTATNSRTLPPYTDGGLYSATGLYTVHGCDSTLKLNLTLYKSNSYTMTDYACDEYVWKVKEKYDKDPKLDSRGRDIVAGTEVTYPRGGEAKKYKTDNSTDQLVINTSHGCDSTVTLNLTIKHHERSAIETAICLDKTTEYNWRGNKITPTGEGTIELIDTALIYTTGSLFSDVLFPDFGPWQAFDRVETKYVPAMTTPPYTPAHYETRTYTNPFHCDSIDTLRLSVYKNFLSEPEVVNACGQYLWNSWGYLFNISVSSPKATSYKTETVYYDTLGNAHRYVCDSIHILKLTLFENETVPESRYDRVAACGKYKWLRDNKLYPADADWTPQGYPTGKETTHYYTTTEGYHKDPVTGLDVCDSTYVLKLTTYDSVAIVDTTVCLDQSTNPSFTWNTSNTVYYNSNSWLVGNFTSDESIITGSHDFRTAAKRAALLANAPRYRHGKLPGNACDSVYLLNLTVLPTYYIDVNPTLEDPYSVVCNTYMWYRYKGYNASSKEPEYYNYSEVPYPENIYKDFRYTKASITEHAAGRLSANGCDSIHTLLLTKDDNFCTVTSSSLQEIVSCTEYTIAPGCSTEVHYIPWTKYKSGSYEMSEWKDWPTSKTKLVVDDNTKDYVLRVRMKAANAKGCDSIAFLHIDVRSRMDHVTMAYRCDTLNYKAVVVAKDTDIVTELYKAGSIHQASNGCDSAEVLRVKIFNHAHTTDTLYYCDSLVWHRNNQKYFANVQDSSVHVVMKKAHEHDCDSIVYLYLTIKSHSDTGTFDTARCSQFYWDEFGKTYTSSGKYTNVTQRSYEDGCDTAVRVNLTIFPAKIQDTVVREACSTLTVNNYFIDLGKDSTIIMTESGVALERFWQAYPLKKYELYCDSLEPLKVIIHHAVDKVYDVKACDTLSWNNDFFGDLHLVERSGKDTVHYDAVSQGPDDEHGCPTFDTLHIVFYANYYDTNVQNVCGSYTWYSKEYTRSIDTHVVSHKIIGYNEDGTPVDAPGVIQCNKDSALVLRVKPYNSGLYEDSSCNTYTWRVEDGYTHTYTADPEAPHTALIEDQHVISRNFEKGCDSTVRLSLRLRRKYIQNDNYNNDELKACDSLRWRNNVKYAEDVSGIEYFVHHEKFEEGCDTSYILNLQLRHSTNIIDTVVSCDEEYEWEYAPGKYWEGKLDHNTSPNVVFKPLDDVNKQECNVNKRLFLTLAKDVESIDKQEGCDQMMWNGTLYNWTEYDNEHKPSVTLTTWQGCDSVVKLEYVHIEELHTVDNRGVVCDSLEWNGYTVKVSCDSSEYYTQHLTSQYGCDSIIHLTVRVTNHTEKVVDSIVACDSYTHTFTSGINAGKTVTFTKSDIFHDGNETPDIYSTCPVWLMHKLVINHADSATILQESVCESYTWEQPEGKYYKKNSFNRVITSTGVYVDTLQTIHSCDSIVKLDIYVAHTDTAYKHVYACDTDRVVIESSASTDTVYNNFFMVTDGISYGETQTTGAVKVGKRLGVNDVCDSFVTVTVHLGAKKVMPIEHVACGSFDYVDGYGKHSNIDHNVVDSLVKVGTYVVDAVNNLSCDSLESLRITIKHPVTVTLDSVVSCDSLRWSVDNTLYTATGWMEMVEENAVDGVCSKTTRQYLTVNTGDYNSKEIRGLDLVYYIKRDGSEVSFRSLDGEYQQFVDEYLNTLGCPSYDTVHLYFSNKGKKYVKEACDSVEFNSKWYYLSGTYYDTVKDSKDNYFVDTLEVVISKTQRRKVDTIFCSPQVYRWNDGATVLANADSTYVHTYPTGTCTSYDTLVLSYASHRIDTVECNEFWWYDGNRETYYNSGRYLYQHDVYRYQPGDVTKLDSFVCAAADTLVLTIKHSTLGEPLYRTVCDSFVVDASIAMGQHTGEVYKHNGLEQLVYVNAEGCSSSVDLHLTVNESVQTIDAQQSCGAYTWTDGKTYSNTIKSPVQRLKRANGCDSIVTLHLEVLHHDTIDTAAVNSCDKFVWYGNTLTETGTYTQVVGKHADGCDSVKKMHLTINHSTEGVDKHVSCDQVFNWKITRIDGIEKDYGNIDYLSGNKKPNDVSPTTLKIPNKAGCDSIVYLDLEFHIPAATSTDTLAKPCDSIRWHGETYTPDNYIPGNAQYTYTDQYGCDSLVYLSIPTWYHTAYDTVKDTACDTYTWHNMKGSVQFASEETYTVTGKYTYTAKRQAVGGCDSVITLDLYLDQDRTERSRIETVLACDTITWRDGVRRNYDVGGDSVTWQGNKATPKSCDSTLVLNLTVQKSKQYWGRVDTTVCDTFFFAGNKYYASSTLEDSVLAKVTPADNPAGACDSTYFIVLNVKKSGVDSVSVEPCDSVSYSNIFVDTVYRTSGTWNYRKANVAKNGCDSLFVLTLNVRHASHNVYTDSVCDSVTWYGMLFGMADARDADGNKNPFVEEKLRTYTNDEMCESVDTLRVTIFPNSYDTIRDTACDMYSGSSKWTHELDTVFTESTEFEESHPTIYYTDGGGNTVMTCRNYEHLSLIVNTSNNYDSVTYACDTFVWVHTYSPRTYEEYKNAVDSVSSKKISQHSDGTALKTVAGCDSTITLHITIFHSDTTAEDLHHYDYAVCDSLEWNGMKFFDDTANVRYNTKIANYSLVNTKVKDGCDSAVYLTLRLAKHYDSITDTHACHEFTWKNINGSDKMFGGLAVHSVKDTVKANAKTIHGCDSTLILNLQIYESKTFNIDTIICDSIIWNDIHVLDAGKYQYKSTTVEGGCDSTVTLTVTQKLGTFVYPAYLDVRHDVATVCDSFVWQRGTHGDTMLYATGVYYDTLKTVLTFDGVSCDSVITLDLTVKDSTWGNATIEVCDRFEHKGVEYWYPDHLFPANDTLINGNEAGCDSIIVLNFVSRSHDEQDTTAYACDFFVWRGDTLTESGNGRDLERYRDTMVNSIGCDSIIYLNLTIYKHKNDTLWSQPQVGCEPVTYNDKQYYSDTIVLKSNNEEDQYRIEPATNTCKLWQWTPIVVHPIVHDTIYRYGVNGKFDWDTTNFVWNDDAKRRDTVTISSPEMRTTYHCDSTLTVVLQIFDSVVRKDTFYACDNYRVVMTAVDNVNDTLLDTLCRQTADFRRVVGKTNTGIVGVGSDSIYLVHVHIYAKQENVIEPVICNSEKYTCPFDRKEYFSTVDTIIDTIFNTGRTYHVDTLSNGKHECDSVNRMILTINVPKYNRFDTTVCDNSYIWHRDGGNDTVITTTGKYVCHYYDGCDNYDTIYFTNHSTNTVVDTCALWAVKDTNNVDRWGYRTGRWGNIYGLDADKQYVYIDSVQRSIGKHCQYSYDTLKITLHYNVYNTDTRSYVCDYMHWRIDDLPEFDSLLTEAKDYVYETYTEFMCERRDTLHLLAVYHKIDTTYSDSVCIHALPYSGYGFSTPNAPLYLLQGQSMVWEGHHNNRSVASLGRCDSVTHFYLTINTGDTAEVEHITYSQCGSYTWEANDSTYTNYESANPTWLLNIRDTHEYNNVHGCLSYRYLWIDRIGKALHDTFHVSACDSYTWSQLDYGSQRYNEVRTLDSTGVYVNEYIYGVNNCSSADTLYLTIRKSTEYVEEDSICYGAKSGYSWKHVDADGFWADVDIMADYPSIRQGVLRDTVTTKNSAGCDSLRILALKINPVDTLYDIETACDSFRWDVNNKLYNANIEVLDSAANAITKCWQYKQLTLTVNYSQKNDTPVDSNFKYAALWKGSVITENTQVSDTLEGVNGCDSVVTRNLIIHSDMYDEVDTNYCYDGVHSFFWEVTKKVYPTDTVVTVNVGTTPYGAVQYKVLKLHYRMPVEYDTTITNCISYDWKHKGSDEVVKHFTASGSYDDYSLKTIYGCDSTIHLHVNIPVNGKGVRIDSVVCRNQAFTWHKKNGIALPVNVKDELKYNGGKATQVDTARFDMDGCYSIDTLYLTVKDTSVSTEEVINDYQCGSYTWQGITMSNIGLDCNEATVTLTNSVGCDSVATVKVHEIVSPKGVVYRVDTCNFYEWGGTKRYQSGKYTCLSHDNTYTRCAVMDTLQLTLRKSTNTPYVLSKCDTFVWSKTTAQESYSIRYVAPGKDTSIDAVQKYINGDRCESYDTLHLTLYASTHKVKVDSICQGDRYRWDRNERFYTNDTTVVYRYDRAGTDCKNVDTLHLIVNQPDAFRFDTIVCDGIVWHDNNGGTKFFTESNDYLYNYNNIHGCKSDSLMHLVVVESFEQHDTIVRCNTIDEWQGYFLNAPVNVDADTAKRFVTVRNPHCDSVYYLHYHLNYVQAVAYYDTACNEYTWNIDGKQIVCTDDTNYYTWDATTGCGRVDTLYLKLYNSDHLALDTFACGSFHWDMTDRDYDTDTVYTYLFNNDNGCASDAVLTLDIYPVYPDVRIEDTMACDRFDFGGYSYTQSTNNVWTANFKTVMGCDSNVTIKHLTVNYYKKRQFAAEDCDRYDWRVKYVDGSQKTIHYTDSKVDTVSVGTNVGGCDSIHIINVTIHKADTTPDTIAACDLAFYHGHTGLDHTLDTTFLEHNTYGCDSIIKLHVIINKSNMVSMPNMNVCDSLRWTLGDWDTLLTRSGSYQKHYKNIYGCDSIVMLPLAIYHNDTTVENVEACEKYRWMPSYFLDSLFTESTSYTFSDTLSVSMMTGCHPVYTLNLTINSKDTNKIDILACDDYEYRRPGSGARLLTRDTVINEVYYSTKDGKCDSVVSLNISIKQNTFANHDTAFCDSVLWQRTGVVYSQSQRFVDTVRNTQGCDSIITYALTINHGEVVHDTHTECNGRYVWWRNNKPYSMSTLDSYRYANQTGCVSTAYLHLTIARSSSSIESQEVCDSFVWKGNRLFTKSVDTATYHTINAAGCDSLITLHLTVRYGSYDTTNIITCNPYKWEAGNNQTYTETGVYTLGYLNEVNCPSQHILTLVNNAIRKEFYKSGCDSVVLSNGDRFFHSETVNHVTHNYNGSSCDSVAVIKVQVFHSLDTIVRATACDTFVWNITGETYRRSATVRNEGISTAGCDSSYTLMLTVNKSSHQIIDTVVVGTDCDWHEMLIVSPGYYDYALKNVYGCDSVITLHITEFLVGTRPVIVSDPDGKLLMVNHYPDGEGGDRVDYFAYRWYKDGRLMYGANDDQYHNTDWSVLDGCYYVMGATDKDQQHWVRSQQVCFGTHEGINTVEEEAIQFMLYPNPSRQNATVTIRTDADESLLIGGAVILYDLHGREVMNVDLQGKTTVFNANVPAGVYSMRIVTADGRAATRHFVVK